VSRDPGNSSIGRIIELDRCHSVKVNVLWAKRSGLKTEVAQIPTPDFAVPYEAPKHVKTMAEVQPMAPKNGFLCMLATGPSQEMGYLRHKQDYSKESISSAPYCEMGRRLKEDNIPVVRCHAAADEIRCGLESQGIGRRSLSHQENR
jgi:hypothetical protein